MPSQDTYEKLSAYFGSLTKFLEKAVFGVTGGGESPGEGWVGPVPHDGAKEMGLLPQQVQKAGGTEVAGGGKVMARYRDGDMHSAVVTKITIEPATMQPRYDVEYDGYLVGATTITLHYPADQGGDFEVAILVTGMGDLVFARAFQGLGDKRFCDKEEVCNKCRVDKSDLTTIAIHEKLRSYVRSCHLAHQPAHPGDFPLSCPCCSFTAADAAAVSDEAKTASAIKVRVRS